MSDQQDPAKSNKLADIENISFGDDVGEISSSLEMVLTLYEVDDDAEIIQACKKKLEEGVQKLKDLGANEEARQFKKDE